LETIAYTVKGWAIEDGANPRTRGEAVLAHSTKLTTSVTSIVNKLREQGLPDSDIFRNAATAREKGELEVGLARFLVVGYALRVADKKFNMAIGKKVRIGSEKTHPKYTIKWNEKEIPLLVVTDIVEEKPDSMLLWALLAPKNGLCTAHQIAQDQVFYRSEFCNSNTSVIRRSTAWNKLVAAQSVRPGINKPLSSKQLQYRKAKDRARVLLPSTQSFLNEDLLLVSCFEKQRDTWLLEELKTVLSEADEDLRYKPLPKNISLRKFAEKEEKFNDDDTVLLQEELAEIWPEIDSTKESILLLKHAFNSSTLEVIEY
jgi:hypothetical protein